MNTLSDVGLEIRQEGDAVTWELETPVSVLRLNVEDLEHLIRRLQSEQRIMEADQENGLEEEDDLLENTVEAIILDDEEFEDVLDSELATW